MKVLVIPDVHLKPWMFDRAAELLKDGAADRAVCLMDIPDDWRQEFNLDLYVQTSTLPFSSRRISLRHSGATAIMIPAIPGTRGRPDIQRSHRGLSVKSSGNCRRLCRMKNS